MTLDAAGACSRVRIGVTGAGPAASRARRAERYLAGKAPTEATLEAAAARTADGIDFTDDLHGSTVYREHLTRRLTFRTLSAAVERVADRAGKVRFDPPGRVGGYFAERAQAHGVIIRNLMDTIAFCPPLIITEDQIDSLVERFARALDDTTSWVENEGLASVA